MPGAWGGLSRVTVCHPHLHQLVAHSLCTLRVGAGGCFLAPTAPLFPATFQASAATRGPLL